MERVSYQSILDRAAAESAGWRRLTVRFPADAGDVPLTVQVDYGSPRQPAKRANLTFDPSNGALTARASSQPASRGQPIRSWLRFAHTGEVYGFVGQTIAGIASAGSMVLVWTGLALTWRRFFRARKPAAADWRPAVDPVAVPPNPTVASRWEPVPVNVHQARREPRSNR